MELPMQVYYICVPISGVLMVLYCLQRLITFTKELKEENSMEIQAAIVLVLVFFLMLAMSVPVSFSIISASLLTIIMFLTPGFGMVCLCPEDCQRH